MSIFDSGAERLLDRMRAASGAAERLEHVSFQFPGFGVVAIGAESRIGHILLPAFEHLRSEAPEGPLYEWYLTDIPDKGPAAFFSPDPTQYGEFRHGPAMSVMIEHRGPVLTAFEPAKRRLTTIALEDHLVRSDQSAKPLLRFLFGMTSENGWHLAHAAAIGFNGRGLLVPGSGGAGKSTLSAACTMSGAEFAGDDFVAIRKIGEDWHAHSLFATLMLFAEQAARFPGLPCASASDGIDNTRKTQLRVRASDGMKPVASMKIDGVALPQIVDQKQSEIVPGRHGVNARAILPHSALLAPPVRSARQTETLLDLAAEAEALTYRSGSDYRLSVAPLRARYDLLPAGP